MSAFQLSDTLADINGGADSVRVTQIYPMSGNIVNSIVGQGQASGLTNFQFQDTVNWWLPESSYFRLRLQFRKSAGVIPSTDGVTYVDNFVHTLFTQCQTQINSQQLDIVNFPWIIDQALCYSQSRRTFLETWGSLSRVGESFMTRVNNVSANSGIVEVVFRPPVSLFSAKICPPGAQFLLQFNWAGNGLAALEPASNAAAVTWGTGATNYDIVVQDFSFFKATIMPSPSVSLPPHGVIDLSCSVVNQTYTNGSTQINYQWSPPGFVNRLTICMQDANAASNLANGLGVYSATKFNYAVSDASDVAYNSPINTLYVSIPELGCQMPNPTYTFSGIIDWMRAYADFCESTQGAAFSVEGSIPFGSQVVNSSLTNLSNAGVNKLLFTTAAPTGSTNAVQFTSSPDNKNAYYAQPEITAIAPTASTITPYAKQSAYGWAGSPMFVFPIVRPAGKPISTLNLNVQLTNNPKNAVFWLISTYNMALACEHAGNGQYKYSVINGI